MPNVEEIIEFGRKVSGKESPIIGIYKYSPDFYQLIEKLRVRGFLVVLYDDTKTVKVPGYEITDKLEAFKKKMDVVVLAQNDQLPGIQEKVFKTA